MTINRLLLQQAVAQLAPSVRAASLEDVAFARTAGYKTKRTLSFGSLTFEVSELARAARAAFGNKAGPLRTQDGEQVTLTIAPDNGYITCDTGTKRLTLPQLTVFSPLQEQRVQATKAIPEFEGLLPNERERWKSALATRPLTAANFTALLDDLQNTPVGYYLAMARRGPDRPTTLDDFAPSQLDLLARTIGSKRGAVSSVATHLAMRQTDWIEMQRARPLRLALATVGRPDNNFSVPHDETQALALASRVADLEPDLDPFGCVAAIEFLVAVAAKYSSALDLSAHVVAKFALRLPQLDAELKVFAAAFLLLHSQQSVGATRELSWKHRRAFSWTLASLSTRLLGDRVDAADFLKWALEELGTRYRISVALNKRTAPRWNWSDIDPGQLRSETFGRLQHLDARFPDVSAHIGLKALLAEQTVIAKENHSHFFWFIPGPLEAERPKIKEAARIAPELELQATEALARDDPKTAFVIACNLSKRSVPGPALVKAVAERLRHVTPAQIVNAKQRVEEFVSHLASFASGANSAPIAERLSDLVTGAPTPPTPDFVHGAFYILLECAAVTGSARLADGLGRLGNVCVDPMASRTLENLVIELMSHGLPERDGLLPVLAVARLNTGTAND